MASFYAGFKGRKAALPFPIEDNEDERWAWKPQHVDNDVDRANASTSSTTHLTNCTANGVSHGATNGMALSGKVLNGDASVGAGGTSNATINRVVNGSNGQHAYKWTSEPFDCEISSAQSPAVVNGSDRQPAYKWTAEPFAFDGENISGQSPPRVVPSAPVAKPATTMPKSLYGNLSKGYWARTKEQEAKEQKPTQSAIKQIEPAPRWRGPRQAPKPGAWEQAIATLSEIRSSRRDTFDASAPDPAPYSTAAFACVAAGEHQQALAVLADLEADYGAPSVRTARAALEACEMLGGGESLKQAWSVLGQLWAQGLSQNSSCQYEAKRQAEGELDGLQYHAQIWLSQKQGSRPLPTEAHSMAVQMVSSLRQQGSLDPIVESSFRHTVLDHIIDDLEQQCWNLEVGRASVLGLGAFSHEALESWGIDCSSHRWHTVARSLLQQQRMVHRWATWSDASAAQGHLAWISYDISAGPENGNWDLVCSGEVFGSASEQVDHPALPADLRAISALSDEILGRLQCDSGVVEGIVQLYADRAPSAATLAALHRFVQAFPWVKLSFGYGQSGALQQPLTILESGRLRVTGKKGPTAEEEQAFWTRLKEKRKPKEEESEDTEGQKAKHSEVIKD